MAALSQSWLDDAFTSAKEDFKRSLKNPSAYDFSSLTSIDDVLEEAKKVERQQAKTKTLRGLKRIQPFIHGLKEYSEVIETFAQVKPDIMSLIWVSIASIQLYICLWSGRLTTSLLHIRDHSNSSSR